MDQNKWTKINGPKKMDQNKQTKKKDQKKWTKINGPK